MGIGTYKKGHIARVSALFKDLAGTLVDPDTVALRITKPSGVQVTETYNPGTIVRNSVGSFRFDLSIDQAGEWHYVWISTGTAQATEHGEFMVEAKA